MSIPSSKVHKTDKYSWSQTLTEATITITSDVVVRGRDLFVKMDKQYLTVKNKISNEIYIDGTLHKSIKIDDSTWSVVDGKTITIELFKIKSEWWSCIVQGEQEIDVTQITPENSSLNDLDGETRTMVEKMMFNQRQKAAGLPTTDDEEKERHLQEFKDLNPNLDFSGATFNK
ncbi:nuclear distribution protein C [Cavenderia fasciculata]|uniref:Nuclear distribution protein C n=1 Tax=Cavenderia fasciculata TaxID=261658 RepID=F4PPT0_CACFS|nr:nuclear distribution protein C [Cavenderia fasciculata]EGG22393.1 nuclear distribution protein C [Cavenderia fasciculata]|eukprot:XP_004360244.1 nuclear distribution protein C [Cavenderia fasciculata]